MKILISFAGGTDPVAANAYDGPLMHIVRHYRPDRVLLLLTEEMERLAGKDNRYERAVNWLSCALGFECLVESRMTGIKNAHDFDAFQGLVNSEIRPFIERHPQAEILFNISSGTPQITATLCLAAVTIGGVKPVQVATPVGAMNAGTKHLKNFDEGVLENDFDQLDQKNRCIEPHIMGFRKTMVVSRLRELINNYDYLAARRLLDSEAGLDWPVALISAVSHGAERLNLNNRAALKYSHEMEGFTAYPVQYKPAARVLDYYLAAKVKQRRGELADFILRLSPLLQHLLEEYVGMIPGFRLNVICEQSNGVDYIKGALIKQRYPELFAYLNEQYSRGFRDGPKNSDILLNIAFFYSNQIRSKSEEAWNLLPDFERLRKIEYEIRNRLAHQMTEVTEPMLVKVNGLSSKSILQILERSIICLYGTHLASGCFAVYESLNSYIFKILEQI